MPLAHPEIETLNTTLVDEALRVSPDDKGTQRFQALAYSGAVVDRDYGKFVIDFEGIRMKDKIPMLVDHDGTKRAGFADKRVITDRGLELEGVLSKSTDAGREVTNLSKEGFPWELSVGIRVARREEVDAGETCEVNGETLAGPLSIARECTLKEVSFLFSGADANTEAVALAAAQTPKEAPVAETAQAAQADPREELRSFLATFPGEEGLAAQRFAEGKSVKDVRLEIAQRDSESLAALRVEHEALKAENAKLTEKLAAIEALDKQAGEPGVGYRGTEVDLSSVDPKHVTNYNEAWNASEKLRSEFQNNKERFLRFCERELPALSELI